MIRTDMANRALRMSPVLSHGRRTSGAASPIVLAAPHTNNSSRDALLEASSQRIYSDHVRGCEEPLRILLTSRHRYPAGGSVGVGRCASPRVTGGASIIHDLLAK